MKEHHPLPIRHSIALAIGLTVASTCLGAGALYGYQCFRTARQSQNLRTLAFAESYAALLAPAVAAKAEPLSATLGRLALHPDACLLAVVDANRETLAVRGSENLLQQYRRETGIPAGPSVTSFTLPADAQGGIPELQLATVPIRLAGGDSLGTLVCAIRPSQRTKLPAQLVWTFFARLGLIAAAGALLGLWLLRNNVLAPLALLTGGSKDRPATPLPTDRDDEIGQLARVLSEMHISLEEWRQRAMRLERTVQSRVAEQTREVARELQQTKRKIWTDPLTKLGNRRLLDERFDDIFRLQVEAGQDLAVVMLDVDNFKVINDTLGHKAGDEVLRFTGELLRQCLREQDLAVRVGGDEFLLILPGVSAKNAHAVAERTLLLFGQQCRLLEVPIKPTMSAGIASVWQHRPADASELVHLADEAMYAAKKQGKCRAVIHDAVLAPAHA